MNSIYSPKDSSLRNARVCSYFYEIPCQCNLFNISPKNFNLEQNDVSSIKFAEFYRAVAKKANEEYLQKN